MGVGAMQGDRGNMLPPGEWVPNDFKVGDSVVVEGQGMGRVTGKNDMHYQGLELLVDFGRLLPERVWPNLQWMTYGVPEGDDV